MKVFRIYDDSEERYYSDVENDVEERLYSTGDETLDELLERAFCEGYEYAQKEFGKDDSLFAEKFGYDGPNAVREFRADRKAGVVGGAFKVPTANGGKQRVELRADYDDIVHGPQINKRINNRAASTACGGTRKLMAGYNDIEQRKVANAITARRTNLNYMPPKKFRI